MNPGELQLPGFEWGNLFQGEIEPQPATETL